jgi:epoxyqueuosine reductase
MRAPAPVSEQTGARVDGASGAPAALTARVKALARELGFHGAGIARVERPETADAYERWVEAGQHGEMEYMARERNRVRRLDPQEILPGARSVVVVQLLYEPAGWPLTGDVPSGHGQVARYAAGADYHEVMLPRLERLGAALAEWCGAESRAYVDTGPIMERDLAARAGLGWFGKNSMLLDRRLGSYTFLGVLLTTADLTLEEPVSAHCGTCSRCLDVCPTGALVEPGVLDARRCISYLTIELKGPIPRELRPAIGNMIYGCDICQEVCPWNRKAPKTDDPAFAPREGLPAPELAPLLSLTEEEFRARFRDTVFWRLKRRRLLRNVAVALGNSGDRRHVPVLAAALGDGESLVRGHAVWALGRLGGTEALDALRRRLLVEEDAYVREELEAALAEHAVARAA